MGRAGKQRRECIRVRQGEVDWQEAEPGREPEGDGQDVGPLFKRIYPFEARRKQAGTERRRQDLRDQEKSERARWSTFRP
jgi:hypothetical protein